MTSGKWVVLAILGITAVFGAVQWYFQTRAYYETVDAVGTALTIAHEVQGTAPLSFEHFEGIDADTSPLRFRACFQLTPEAMALFDGAEMHPDPTPLIAPGWFDCFDAADIGAALETGAARAYLAQSEIHRGADRIVAVFPDGRGFAWHQLNGTLE